MAAPPVKARHVKVAAQSDLDCALHPARRMFQSSTGVPSYQAARRQTESFVSATSTKTVKQDPSQVGWDLSRTPTFASGRAKLPGTQVPPIQRKLAVGQVDDPLEQEADRIADHIVGTSAPANVGTSTTSRPRVPTRTVLHSGNFEASQFKADSSKNTVPVAVADRIANMRGSGSSLEPTLQAHMEARFDTDFSDIRIHDDTEAGKLNRQLGARAFTTGSDIFFDHGISFRDSHLLAHELAHVVQQRSLYLNQISQPGLIQRAAAPMGASTGEPGNRPNLDINDFGPGVLLLQRLLGVPQTGTFDETTRKAVVDFQQARPELHPATGGVGPKTWKALDAIAARADIPTGSPGKRPSLDMNDAGPAVTLLQTLLGIRPTGVFDEETRKAVVDFQQARPELHPATGGVGPKTWQALDESNPTGQVKVGDAVIGDGMLSFATAGGVVTGLQEIARGPLTLNGTLLAGGVPVVAYQGGTVTGIGGTASSGVKPLLDVASKSKEAVRLAWQMQMNLARSARPPTPPPVPAASLGMVAARGGVATIGFAIGVGLALLPVAFAYAASVAGRMREYGGTLPPGGTPPMQEPDTAEPMYAPAGDAGAPAYTPGKEQAGPAVAPGARDDRVTAPGQSSESIHLSGLRIPLNARRAERLKKAEQAEKWTDLPGRERTSLGKAYNHIVESVVREIASGGRATVLHYPEVTKDLIDQLAKQGGRVLITEGRLPSGGRFDIAEINFDSHSIEHLDLTAMKSSQHAGKTGSYDAELHALTGFPVTSYEAQYVGGDEKLADEIIFVKVSK